MKFLALIILLVSCSPKKEIAETKINIDTKPIQSACQKLAAGNRFRELEMFSHKLCVVKNQFEEFKYQEEIYSLEGDTPSLIHKSQVFGSAECGEPVFESQIEELNLLIDTKAVWHLVIAEKFTTNQCNDNEDEEISHRGFLYNVADGKPLKLSFDLTGIEMLEKAAFQDEKNEYSLRYTNGEYKLVKYIGPNWRYIFEEFAKFEDDGEVQGLKNAITELHKPEAARFPTQGYRDMANYIEANAQEIFSKERIIEQPLLMEFKVAFKSYSDGALAESL